VIDAVPGEAPASDRAEADLSHHIAVHAPTGRDGPLAVSVLERWGLRATHCRYASSLCEAISGGVAVVLLAEEALTPAHRRLVLAALDDQPSWSDVPIIVMTAEGELSRTIAEGIEAIADRGNVMLLERPVRVATLVTAVRSALRARMRQYEIRDYIVERDRLLRSERRAREDAEQANRAKSDFLAVMSHELRTPLNAIAGYADLIEIGVHGPTSEDQREALRRIKRSERHLLGVINGILNYARVEAGTVPYEIRSVSLRDLVLAATTLVEPQLRQRRLALEVSDCDTRILVRADPDKVNQIILNLLSNAMKFTAPGGRIGVQCTASPGLAWIRVSDTGEGIPPDKLDRIFEPFVQIDSRLTRTQEGVGLGLAISRDLARGMEGDLRAESTVGTGSTFTLSLPRASRRRTDPA
jgi:signal transduction histidine kinase